MQKQKGATSRRRAGIVAAITLAGGLAGTALLMPGTALATGPLNTSTSMNIKASFPDNGENGDEVDVVVSTSTGSPAPTGSVTVTFGSAASGSVSLTPGSGDSSTGNVFFNSGLHNDIPSGVYTVTATYNPADPTAFSGSSVSQSGVVVGTVSKAPVFTADAPPLTASPGEDYDYTFQASGTPAPTYSLASGAPSWLHINSTTGEVSGDVPWWVSWFTYSVTATNSVGSVTAGPFTVQVSAHHHGHANVTTSLSCPSFVSNFGTGTCTLTVTNDSNVTATNVFAEIVLPSQLHARFCQPNGFWFWGGGWNWGGGCTINNNTANLQIGNLGAWQSKQLSVIFIAEASQHFGWWHADRVTVEGIAGSNHQWWWQQQGDSFSFAKVKIWPARFWW